MPGRAHAGQAETRGPRPDKASIKRCCHTGAPTSLQGQQEDGQSKGFSGCGQAVLHWWGRAKPAHQVAHCL